MNKPCKYAVNNSGDCWECGVWKDTYCADQKYDRNPDGTLNTVICLQGGKDDQD